MTGKIIKGTVFFYNNWRHIAALPWGALIMVSDCVCPDYMLSETVRIIPQVIFVN